MIYLLDVNVLVSLLDKAHVHHERARLWFASLPDGWATCPVTEMGVIRVLSQPTYRNSPGTPAQVVSILDVLWRFGDHHFWPDAISLFDTQIFDINYIIKPQQITDSYLLGLAHANGGRLATFDTHLHVAPVPRGEAALFMIP